MVKEGNQSSANLDNTSIEEMPISCSQDGSCDVDQEERPCKPPSRGSCLLTAITDILNGVLDQERLRISGSYEKEAGES